MRLSLTVFNAIAIGKYCIAESFARRKFLSILPPTLGKFLSVNFFSYINDFIDDMITYNVVVRK